MIFFSFPFFFVDFFRGWQMEAILSAFFGIDSNAQMDDNDPAFITARKTLGGRRLQKNFDYDTYKPSWK